MAVRVPPMSMVTVTFVLTEEPVGGCSALSLLTLDTTHGLSEWINGCRRWFDVRRTRRPRLCASAGTNTQRTAVTGTSWGW